MKKKWMVALLMATGLYACSPQIRSYSDYDRDYKIQENTTYSWAAQNPVEWQSNPLYYNELTDKRIKSAVNDLLKVKGYVLADSAADLSIHYHIVVEDRSMLAPDPYGYFYGDYWMAQRSDIFKYREGTLILDFMKNNNKNLLWRGWAVAAIEVVIYESKNVDSIIRSAVAKILKDFPEATGNKGLEITFK